MRIYVLVIEDWSQSIVQVDGRLRIWSGCVCEKVCVYFDVRIYNKNPFFVTRQIQAMW